MELINERKSSDEKDEKGDLLSNLVNANEELMGGGEQRLREEELIGTSFFGSIRWFIYVKSYCSGNALMFYIAGHDVKTL